MDTLAINEKLLASDFSPTQAKAITTAIAESVNGEEYLTKADIAGMATKADLATVESRVEADKANVATKRDIADLRTEMAETKAHLTIVIFSATGLIIATVAVFGFFSN